MDYLAKILDELDRARTKFPLWPVDVIHASGILNEEAGEVMKAALQWTYEEGSKERVEEELIQTGAMVCRMLFNLDNAEPLPSIQHED